MKYREHGVSLRRLEVDHFLPWVGGVPFHSFWTKYEKSIKYFLKRRFFFPLAKFYIFPFFSDIENDKIAVRNLEDKYQNFADPKDLTKAILLFLLWSKICLAYQVIQTSKNRSTENDGINLVYDFSLPRVIVAYIPMLFCKQKNIMTFSYLVFCR